MVLALNDATPQGGALQEQAMSISFNQILGIHQHTVGVRNTRAEVLAGNLANSDTPGFKARDLDFKQALADAAHLEEEHTEAPMVKTSARHMDASMLPHDPELTLKYRLPFQPDTGNGNTVEVDSERMKYVDNMLEHRATLTFLNGRITKLMSALRSNQ